jgi:hypothetical protein
MPGLHYSFTQRRQGQPRLLGQRRTKQPLSVAQHTLTSTPMGLWGTTAGGAPALPQLLNKRLAHRKPLGNLRMALLGRDQRVNDALT